MDHTTGLHQQGRRCFWNRVGQEKLELAKVPEGSVLTVRVLDLDEPRLSFITGDTEQTIEPNAPSEKSQASEKTGTGQEDPQYHLYCKTQQGW